MSKPDDRAEFREQSLRKAERMGGDRELFARSMEVLRHADTHDYSYMWTWMGVPIIQMPADTMATQEVIWSCKPDIIIETGVARGGSVLFMASMLELIGKGKVLGVDIEVRSHNRETIEQHPMAKRVTLIEGPSTTEETLARVRKEIPAGASVMAILDSDHSRDHVLAELRAYAPFVTKGQYLVVADTWLHFVEPEQAPKNRSQFLARGNEPFAAREAFLKETDRFEPDPVINGKLILSSSPGGYLRCTK